jgi:hypothetical protein
MTNFPRLALATASLTAFAGVSSANILTNNGFENNDAWGYLFTLGDTCGYTTDAAHTGTRSFLFGEAADVINLSQAVPFVNGQEYELSFWVLNYGVGNDLLEVSVFASDAPEMTVTTGLVPTGLEAWEQVSLNFTVPAVGGYYRFVFKGYDNNAAFYIDDVSLAAVPSGGTSGLLGLGGLAAVRRRR